MRENVFLRPEWLSLGCVCALGSGIALADRYAWPLLPLGLLLSLALLFVFYGRRWLKWAGVGLFLAFFCLGALRLGWAARTLESLPQHLAGDRLRVEGTLTEKRGIYSSEKGVMGRYVLALETYAYLDEKNFQPGRGKLYLTLPEKDGGYAIGSKLRLTGESRPLHYYQNRGLYDQRHRDQEKEVFMRLFADKTAAVQLITPPGRWQRLLAVLREKLTARYEPLLSKERAPILASLLFGGHYDELPPKVLEDFSTTGLIHILSVSGSHVALLLAVMQIFAKAVGLGKTGRLALSLAFLFLYGALSEFTSPVIRASVMGAVSAFSLSVRREYTAAHALALAAGGMLLWHPYLFFDLSFRLSCGASAGIILFQRPLARVFSFLPALLRDGICICLAAQLLVLPLIVTAFFSLPLYTVFANLLVAPLLDIILVLGLLASLASLVWGSLADLFLSVIKPLLTLALTGNAFLAALPHSRLWLGAPGPFFILSWYLGIGIISIKLGGRQQQRAPCCFEASTSACRLGLLNKTGRKIGAFTLVSAIFFLAFFFYGSRQKGPMVYVLDAGADKVTCIKYDDRTADLWYNESEYTSPEQAAFVVTPALRYEGIFRLRRVYLTGGKTASVRDVLARDFVIAEFAAAEKSKPVLPYTVYETLPDRFTGGGLVEIRSLSGWNRKSFPKMAAATIVYPARKGDEAFNEWGETAEMLGQPCFSPGRDGELIFSYTDNRWKRIAWKM